MEIPPGRRRRRKDADPFKKVSKVSVFRRRGDSAPARTREFADLSPLRLLRLLGLPPPRPLGRVFRGRHVPGIGPLAARPTRAAFARQAREDARPDAEDAAGGGSGVLVRRHLLGLAPKPLPYPGTHALDDALVGGTVGVGDDDRARPALVELDVETAATQQRSEPAQLIGEAPRRGDEGDQSDRSPPARTAYLHPGYDDSRVVRGYYGRLRRSTGASTPRTPRTRRSLATAARSQSLSQHGSRLRMFSSTPRAYVVIALRALAYTAEVRLLPQ